MWRCGDSLIRDSGMVNSEIVISKKISVVQSTLYNLQYSWFKLNNKHQTTNNKRLPRSYVARNDRQDQTDNR